MVDQTQISLDGDLDGRPGGEFDFWFLPSGSDTIFVSQGPALGVGQPGSATNPLTSVEDAVALAGVEYIQQLNVNGKLQQKQVRVVDGNYSIGNNPLVSPSLELPQGVQLVVDAGTTFTMQRSRIGVGSTTEGVDRSNSSIQILGIPGNPVSFGSATGARGDWGGIEIRGDIDARDDSRVNLEEAGVFLNHIQYAEIRDGGGPVGVDGVQRAVSPIEMALTRPTIINSVISNSADAAMAASPDTFAETRFDEHRFQRMGAFTPDYMRAGPHIRGNEITGNTLNGLFVRVATPTGGELQSLEVTARIDDTDIVHILTENLQIEGKPGGVDAGVEEPSVLLVQGNIGGNGDLPIGSYAYRLTFVNQDGYETAPSDQTAVFNVLSNDASITLSGLPAVPTELREMGFTGRRIYRAAVDASGNPIEPFLQVKRLNSSDRTFTDALSPTDAATVGIELQLRDDVRLARLDPSLKIDPGTVMKFRGSRIDAVLGSHLYAEGTASQPIVMTSTSDNRYGAAGSFDTDSTDGSGATLIPGAWGGVYVGFGAEASFDHVTLAGGGGPTRVEGGFGSFNAIEVHQGDLRVANSRSRMRTGEASSMIREMFAQDGLGVVTMQAARSLLVRRSWSSLIMSLWMARLSYVIRHQQFHLARRGR